MEYRADYEINGGVESFGGRYQDSTERVELIDAESDIEAMVKALRLAGSFAVDYLSNPDTGYTTVMLSSLKDRNNRELSQENLIDGDTIEFDVDLDSGKKRNCTAGVRFKEGKAIVKCDSLDKILILTPLEK